MQSTNDGLRARKKRLTRARIEQAGLRLMAERGYERVSVEDITAAADVAPRTFYRYFTSKDDVVLGRQEEYIEILRDAVQRHAVDGATLRAVVGAVRELATSLDADRDDILATSALVQRHPALERKSLEARRKWSETIEAALRHVDPSVTPITAAALAGTGVAVAWAGVQAWVDGRAGEPLVELVDRAAAELLAAAR